MTDVAIISPIPAVRAGLRALLEAAGHRVVGEAGLPVPAGFEYTPDIVVFDTGAEADLSTVLAAASLAPGIVVLGSDGGARLPRALAVRPFAYLSRDVDPKQLALAVSAVGAGMTVLDPLAAEDLFSPAALDVNGSSGPSDTGEAGSTENTGQLTPRERQVLQLVAEGLPNKHIARRLTISEHTVKFHVASVMAKLGAASRTEAVHLAARSGLVAL